MAVKKPLNKIAVKQLQEWVKTKGPGMRNSDYLTPRQNTRAYRGYIRMKAESLHLVEESPRLGGRTTPKAERAELKVKGKGGGRVGGAAGGALNVIGDIRMAHDFAKGVKQGKAMAEKNTPTGVTFAGKPFRSKRKK